MNPSGFYVDPFFLRCTLYYAVIAHDKFRFAAANHTVSICGLYSPQLATVEPAIAKRVFCWYTAAFTMLLYDIIHYRQWYFLQGIPTETANVYTFSVYILVYMSGIIQDKMRLYFCWKTGRSEKNKISNLDKEHKKSFINQWFTKP